MTFSKNLKNFFSFLIVFNLVFTQTINATGITGINSTNRTVDISQDMIRSDTPSDLPVAAVSDFFDKEEIDLIRNYDISGYTGKKIFVGYGIYDTAQDNCKFIEQPGVSEIDYDSNFAFVHTFNQHSYAISMQRKTYSECQSLGDRFGGYPVVVDSHAENGFLKNMFTQKEINGAEVEKIWIGATKNDCSIQLYTNELGNNQNYENWASSEIALSCDTTKPNIKQNRTGDWEKTNGAVQAFCVIEFDSNDIYKPLRVCAPWWKVLRDYPNEENSLYDNEELKRINQADIPETLSICTRYSNEGVTAAENQDSTRIAHCTEYDSRIVVPECIRNIDQPQCHVNECGGYIQNACVLQKTDTVGKGYVKGEVLLDGVITEVKVKDNIVTNEYVCPAAGPSEAYCEEHSVVTIYPQECPNSSGAYQCADLKECILSANVADSNQTRENINDCYDTYSCIKIYGGRDLPPILDASGEVTHLQGKCPAPPVSDNSILEFPVNIQQKYGKKCIEYDEIEVDENVTQKCATERNFSTHMVDMSITEEDIYEDDPDCLRTDTVQESLTDNQIVLTVQNRNYQKLNITKVYLDGNVSNVYNGGSDEYTLVMAMGSPIDAGTENNETTYAEANPGSTAPTLDCSFTDPSSAWFQKNIALFLDGSNNTLDTNLDTEDLTSSTGDVIIRDSIIDSESDCSGYASNHGFGSYLSSYTYSHNDITGVDSCTLHLSKTGADSDMDNIHIISNDSLKYTFSGTMSGMDCLKKAVCMNGHYNESSYASDTTIAQCIVTTGESSPSSYMDKIYEEAGIDTTPTTSILTEDQVVPLETQEQVATTININGLEAILVFEDYVRGGFGYYSNYNSWPTKSNRVLVNTSEISDGILPFRDMSTINDYLQYNGILYHQSHLAGSTDEAAAIGGGALVGTALYASAAASAAATSAGMTTLASLLPAMGATGIGIVVVVVIIIILLIMAATKKMDRQYTEYHVYRDVPLSLYEDNPYETRVYGQDAYVESEQSTHNDPSGYKRMTFYHMKTDTGRYERSDFLKALESSKDVKYNAMLMGGIAYSEIDRLTHQDERSINYGYPSCPWYNPWCHKMDAHFAQVVTNVQMAQELVTAPSVPVLGAPYALTDKSKMLKRTGTIYLGATNTLVILVPFAGDYKVEAYNQYDSLLSSRTLVEAAFAGVTDPNDLKFAQVNFGFSMNIAPGLTDGDNIDACKKDRAVEWGGGVSGVFFEDQRTDLSTYCQKSNNDYVNDQAMTKLFVQPLNMDRGFTYELIRPMPFPNRVWIATLDNREVRNYRCYDAWQDCTGNDFMEVE